MVQVVQVRVRPPRGYMDHVPSQPTFDMLTVLVVDDDRELRESLCAFLRQRGCSVTAAAGGVEGLQAVILRTLDVVGTDPQLHGSGWVWGPGTSPRPGLLGRLILFTAARRSAARTRAGSARRVPGNAAPAPGGSGRGWRGTGGAAPRGGTGPQPRAPRRTAPPDAAGRP